MSASLLGLLASAFFAYRRQQQHHELDAARDALGRGDTAAALAELDKLPPNLAGKAEVAYLAAVAWRRSGRLGEFSERIEQARALGWAVIDVDRQFLLAAAQTGDSEAIQAALAVASQETVSDEVAEETYEALAKGYMATYQMREAWRVLDAWLQWRPNAAIAHFMRGDIYERQDNQTAAAEDYAAVLEVQPNRNVARRKLAAALIKLKKVQEARGHYQQCLQYDEQDIDALLGLVDCERMVGSTETAQQHLSQVLAKPISTAQRAAALAAKGQLELAAGKPAEAVQSLSESIALAPAENVARYNLARALTMLGDQETARFHMQRADQTRKQYERLAAITERLADEPANADLRCEAGVILIQQGMIEEGLGWIRTALKFDPNHKRSSEYLLGSGTFQRGLDAYAKHDGPGLLQALQTLEKVPGFEPHVALLKGMNLKAQGRPLDALEQFGLARDHMETRTLAYLLSGEILYQRKHYADAERVLLIATNLDPLLVDGHRWLAATYHDIGANDQAISTLNEVVKLAPEDPRPHRLMGMMYKDFEAYDNAIDQYRESLQKGPNQPDAPAIRTELATCLVKQRLHTEALEVLQGGPITPDTLVLQAKCHHALGNLPETRRILDQVVRIQPGHQDGLELLATIAMEANDPASAVAALKQAVQHHPKHWPLHYQLSRAYQRLGQTKEAEDALATMTALRQQWEAFADLHKKAIAQPENAKLRLELGEAAAALDRPELAINWFAAAWGMDPTLTIARDRIEKLTGNSGPRTNSKGTEATGSDQKAKATTNESTGQLGQTKSAVKGS